MRKYSLPFPLLNANESVDEFIEYFKPYKENIDNFYLGISDFGNNFHNHKSILMNCANQGDYDTISYEFLEKSKGIFKRIVALNSGVYNIPYEELVNYVYNVIVPFTEKYEIDGYIMTDFVMAALLHEAMPNLELHSSCNSFITTKREMDMWHEYAGITVFNPPRDFLRTPSKLKEMRTTGYKLKYLCNESCLFGCPQCHNHVMAQAVGNNKFCACCYHHKGENFLKGVYILPRWQKLVDEYVDIYKISGRLESFERLKVTFDAYLNERDDVNLGYITVGAGSSIETGRGFYGFEIPDRLLTCECKDCGVSCNLCREIYLKKYVDVPVQTSNVEDVVIYYECELGTEMFEQMRKSMSAIAQYNGCYYNEGINKKGRYIEVVLG